MEKKWKPGEQVPETGEYLAHDKKGRTDGEATYLEEGKRFPATQHEGSYYTKEMER